MDEREPELQQGYACPCPVWFHPRGDKMRVFTMDLEKKYLILKASVAQLTVMRHDTFVDRWIVSWDVNWARHEGVHGTLIMPTELLGRAFGLTDTTEAAGKRLIKRYGGDTAFQGRYIRWRNFLNIPGPGTGYDGDSNISITLSDEIKEAVRQLLKLS